VFLHIDNLAITVHSIHNHQQQLSLLHYWMKRASSLKNIYEWSKT